MNRLNLCAVALLTVFSLHAVPVLAQEESAASVHDAEASSGVGHTADHADDHHGHAEVTWQNDLPLWSLVAFILFVLAVKKLGLWDHMKTSMANREAREQGVIQSAEEDLSQAHNVLRDARSKIEAMDETVREILAEAGRDADYTRNEIINHAEREAQAAVERARYEIDRVTTQSLNDLFERLADRVATVTEDRLKSELQDADQDRLINTTLDQLTIRS